MQLEQELEFFNKTTTIEPKIEAYESQRVKNPECQKGMLLKIAEITKMNPANLLIFNLIVFVFLPTLLYWFFYKPVHGIEYSSIFFSLASIIGEMTLMFLCGDTVDSLYQKQKEQYSYSVKFTPFLNDLVYVLDMISRKENTHFTYQIENKILTVYEVYGESQYFVRSFKYIEDNNEYSTDNLDIHSIANIIYEGHKNVLEERFASNLNNELERMKELDFELFFEISKSYKGEKLLKEFKRLKGIK